MSERIKLSYKQRADLKRLADPNDPIKTRGCTNATLSSLEKRGLAHLAFVPSEHVANCRVELWTITDAGRAWLAAAKGSQP